MEQFIAMVRSSCRTEDADGTRTPDARVDVDHRRARDVGALGAATNDRAGARAAGADDLGLCGGATKRARRASRGRDSPDRGPMARSLCEPAAGRLAR